MQKWEYLFATWVDSKLGWRANDKRQIDSPSPQNPRTPIYEIANRLGGEGWELIAEDSGRHLVFKRPISN